MRSGLDGSVTVKYNEDVDLAGRHIVRFAEYVDKRQALVGKPAPDFAAIDRDGARVKLSDFRGKAVILYFGWTPQIVAMWGKSQFSILDEMQRKYSRAGVVVLAVDTGDDRQHFAAFLRAHPRYTMRVLLDPAKQDRLASIATRLYGGGGGLPFAIFIDRRGIVRTYQVGARPRESYIASLREIGV
jgi:peroxiredoxin